MELVDGAVPGLRVRLTPNGTMTWSLLVRVNDERRRLNLGEELGLAEAAERLKTPGDRSRRASTRLPRRRPPGRRKAAAEGHGTLGSVIAGYFGAGTGKDLRSGKAARAVIEVVFAEHLSRPSLDVRPGQLQIAADSWRSQSTAARAVAFFRPLATWAQKRELVVKGFDDLEMPALADDGVETGQHVLSSDEVEKLLRALGWRGHDGAARFMLLTAARREEVVGAVWAEIDLERGTWTIPASRWKDTRARSRRRRPASDHLVPLSRQARALLETLGTGNSVDPVFVGGRGTKLANSPRWSAQTREEDRLRFGDPARPAAHDGYIGGRSRLRAACHFGDAGTSPDRRRADRRLQQEPVYP